MASETGLTLDTIQLQSVNDLDLCTGYLIQEGARLYLENYSSYRERNTENNFRVSNMAARGLNIYLSIIEITVISQNFAVLRYQKIMLFKAETKVSFWFNTFSISLQI